MELKDVNCTVDDPNKKYWIGHTVYAMGYGWENFYTDGAVRIIADENVYSQQSNLVEVTDATYVAREIISDMEETEISKMKTHNYTIIGTDPAETIKTNGLENIFSSTNSVSTKLTTSQIHSQGKILAKDYKMLPSHWK